MFVSRIFLKLLNLLMINSIKMSLLASVLNMAPLKYSYFTYLINLIKVQVVIKSRFLTIFSSILVKAPRPGITPVLILLLVQASTTPAPGLVSQDTALSQSSCLVYSNNCPQELFELYGLGHPSLDKQLKYEQVAMRSEGDSRLWSWRRH